MIIYIFGNGYLVSQKTKELIGEYQKKNPTGFNLVYFNGSEEDIDRLETHLKNESLIPEKKLIVLKNIDSQNSSDIKNLFSKYGISESQTVFVLAPIFGFLSREFNEFLKAKPNKAFEFKDPSPAQVRSWLSDLGKKFNIEFDYDVLDFLVSNFKNDLWRLENEVQKIGALKGRGRVSLNDIKLLVSSETPWGLFDLTDALLMKNKSVFLSTLDKAFKGGTQAIQITSILVWQLTALLRVKEISEKNPQLSQTEIAKRLGLNPFVVKKILPRARFFNTSEIKKFLNYLFDLDLKSKTQETDEILDLTVFTSLF